jgi:hypothetical protein
VGGGGGGGAPRYVNYKNTVKIFSTTQRTWGNKVLNISLYYILLLWGKDILYHVRIGNAQYLQRGTERGSEKQSRNTSLRKTSFHFEIRTRNPPTHHYAGLPIFTPKKKLLLRKRITNNRLDFMKLDPVVQKLMTTWSSYLPLQEVSSKKFTSPSFETFANEDGREQYCPHLFTCVSFYP